MYSRLIVRVLSPINRSLVNKSFATLTDVQHAAAPKPKETVTPDPEANAATNKTYPEKIHRLVDEISKLSLVDVMDLNELLKVMRFVSFDCTTLVT